MDNALVQAGAGFVGGLFGWTLLEYIIHYWLGHLPKGKTMISSEHIKHHKNILYFSPLGLKIRGAIPVIGLAGLLVGIPFGVYAAVGATAAVALGWTAYEVLHKSIHVKGPRTAYGRWAARNHLYHHFVKPNRNHGVTTPLWDYILRTHDKVGRVRIREKDVADIPWLAEAFAHPDSAPRFLQDYELRPAREGGKSIRDIEH